MIKAIIFDFDGVIGSSERARFVFLQKLFAEKGLILHENEFKNIVGRTTDTFLNSVEIKELTTELQEEILAEFAQNYKGNITQYVQPIPIVVNFIKNYKGSLRFAVASGSGLKVLETLTKHFGIFDRFAVIIGKEHVSNYKPHPESYLQAIKALGLQPEEWIVIEDTIVGVRSALQAGSSVYVFLNGVNKKEEFTGLAITGFLETTEDFDKLIKN